MPNIIKDQRYIAIIREPFKQGLRRRLAERLLNAMCHLVLWEEKHFVVYETYVVEHCKVNYGCKGQADTTHIFPDGELSYGLPKDEHTHWKKQPLYPRDDKNGDIGVPDYGSRIED